MTQTHNTTVAQLKQKNERVKLTDSLVSKLNVRAKEYLVRDTEVKSLFIKVQATGNKSYFVQQGQKKKKVAVVGEVTVAQARKLAMELLANGFDFKEKQLQSKLSLSSAYDEYLNSKAFAKGYASPVKQSKRMFHSLLNKPISEITKDQIRSCINNATKISGKPLADATIEVCITIISTVFNYQKKLGKIATSPCEGIRGAGIKPLKSNIKDARLISEADFKTFQEWYLSDPKGSGVSPQNKKDSILVKQAILFMLMTGCRVGEAVNLKTKDVWLNESNEIRSNRIRPKEITFRDTKNKTNHTLQLTPLLYRLVMSSLEANRESIGGDCEYVFRCVALKEQVTYEAMYSRIKKALSKVVVEGGRSLNPHDLRRTFAHHTSKIMADSNVKLLMNHKKKSDMTQRYAGELVDITKDLLLNYQNEIAKNFYIDDAEAEERVYGLGLLHPHHEGIWTKNLLEVKDSFEVAVEAYISEYETY
jgi:integrase